MSADKSLLARRTEITRFKVFSRVRPFIQEEMQYVKGNIFKSVVEMIDNKTILLDPETMNPTKNSFEFDKSLWSIPKTQKVEQIFQDTQRERHDTQLDVYNLVGKGCVEDGFAGYNSCILTYGQTGSGKTHTMMGQYDPKVVCGGEGEEGLIPRVCCDLFVELVKRRQAEEDKPEASRVTYTVELVFVEIYMEKVRDLLDPALERGRDISGSEATIRESPVSGPYLEGVKRYKVESWEDCCKHLERGSRHRTTSATTVHNQSSRSHAIFQLTIMQQTVVPPKDKYSPAGTKTQASRINLVDLAGSERGGFTDYVKESAKINKSLLALRRVIDNLVARQDILMELQRAELEREKAGGVGAIDPSLTNAARNPPAVPYRDSVLTWLLRDSLGGNARTTMIATLSPLAKNYNDTLSTLQWSSKARKLVSVVQKNDPQAVMNNNKSELQSNLLIRQQNVNDLRSTLDAKKDETTSLNEQTASVRKATRRQWSDAEEVRRNAVAVKIQYFIRAYLLRCRARLLEAEKQRHQSILNEAVDTKKEEETLLATKGDDEKAKQEELELLRSHLESTQQTIADHKANREAFEEQSAKVTVQYETIRKEQSKGTESYQQEVEILREENDRAKAEAAEYQQKTLLAMQQLAKMEAEIADLEKTDYEAEAAALEAQTNELNAQLSAAKDAKTEANAKLQLVMQNWKKTFPDGKVKTGTK